MHKKKCMTIANRCKWSVRTLHYIKSSLFCFYLSCFVKNKYINVLVIVYSIYIYIYLPSFWYP